MVPVFFFFNFTAKTTLTRRTLYEILECKSHRLPVWDAKGSQFALDYFPDASCLRARPTNRPYRASGQDSIRPGGYCWPELTLSSVSERNSKFALTGRYEPSDFTRRFFFPLSYYFSRSVLRFFFLGRARCPWKVRDSFDSRRNGVVKCTTLYSLRIGRSRY